MYQRSLQRLCGREGQLPRSFILKEDLTQTSKHPITTGGFADVHFGEYKGQKVALKSLRGAVSDLAKVQKVVDHVSCYPLLSALMRAL